MLGLDPPEGFTWHERIERRGSGNAEASGHS
jgi:hypothetical protein